MSETAYGPLPPPGPDEPQGGMMDIDLASAYPYRFHNATDYSEYRQHEGKRMMILRMLTDDEADPEVGPMFKARTEDGKVISVYPCDCIPVPRAGIRSGTS